MYQIDNRLGQYALSMLTWIAFFVWTETALAEDRMATEEIRTSECMLRIDGVIYDANPCNLDEVDEGVIRFGHFDEDKAEGFWAYLIERERGGFDAYWNEEYGASHAHTSLGVLTKSEFSSADCYSRDKTVLCRNIQPDVPVYYIDYRNADAGNNALMAYLNGVEYELPHPNWEYVYPYSVDDSADFDGDGHLETLIRVGHGGNCCPADLSIVSYRGDGFFNYLDEAPIPGGWGGPEIIEEQAQKLIRIYDIPAGAGSTDWQRSQRDYVIHNGRPLEVVERIEVGVPTAILGFTQEDIRNTEYQEASIDFDIDNDGALDELYCTYWERWGVLNCEANISSLTDPLELQCRQVSISPIVYGPMQSHRLICDGKLVDY